MDVAAVACEVQSHGRVAAAMLAVKIVLTVMFTLMDSMDAQFIAVVCLLAGIVWCGLHVYFMPFYSVSDR